MDNDMICPSCSQFYQNENPPRFVIKCGHTFCQKCIKKLITPYKHQKKNYFKLICPEDKQSITLTDNNINTFPINKALIKIMETNKVTLEFKSDLLEVSKIAKNQQVQGPLDQQTKDLVYSFISPKYKNNDTHVIINQKPEQKQQKQKTTQETKLHQTQLCIYHQKPLQVVCAIDLKKICSNCAIFGQHRGHQFKSMEQIQKQRIDYYHSILSIMQKKQSISQRISSQQTCSSIMEILIKKKQTMKKSISQKYSKLIATIQSKQKQSMKNLQSVILKTQSKLKALMKIDSNTLTKYDQWQQKSYKQIKILQGDDFQAKLQLLFVGIPNEIDVLEEGDAIIQQMNKQQQNLINEVEQALQNIGVDFNMQILNHIDNFVQLYDEKKKKNKSRTSKSQNQSSPTPPTTTSSISKPGINQKKSQQLLTLTPSIPNNSQNQDLLPQKLTKQISNVQQSLLQPLYQDQIKQPHKKQKQFQQISKQQQKQYNKCQQQSQQNFNLRSSRISQKKSQKSYINHQQLTKIKNYYQLTERTNKQSAIKDKINKKKLTKIKIPQKYKKILDNLINDQLQLLDLTNAQLGDTTIIQICQLLKQSKVKTVKLIHNKLTDDVISKIIPNMKNIISLNISQNLFTQKILDIFIDMAEYLKSLKNLIICQNKIVQRKHKAKLQQIKAMNIHISV